MPVTPHSGPLSAGGERESSRLLPSTAIGATCCYVVLTLVMTWPLAARLSTGVPSDLGDPLLNDWILAWNLRHAWQALGGDLGALTAWPHTNIFHPAPYTLGYSELFVTQTVLILPLHAVTGNVVLAYNVLFLAAFVLSGLGMYLFVRALTGDWRAGFIAGAVFAFAPYRFHQAPHLQVMWSAWMPFVLYGLHQWFERTDARAARRGRRAEGQEGRSAEEQERRRAGRGPGASAPGWIMLAGTTVALAAQNLSCGYYMLFFAPFVALYALWEMAWRRRLLDWRTWSALALTGAASLALTWPFMTPYFALRRLGQPPRALAEVTAFSADTFAYLTAHAGQHLWGWLQTFPRAEGSLFPGLLPVLLALLGLAAAVHTAARAPAPHADVSRGRRVTIVFLGLVSAVYFVGFVGLFFGLEGRHTLGPIELRLFSVARPLLIAAVACAALLAVSARARAVGARLLRSPALFAAAAAFLAFWLSLGPVPRVKGDTLEQAALYTWLYHYVPGYSGLRVPARFAMIVVVFLAMGAGLGYRVLAGTSRRWLFPLVLAGLLAEAFVAPLPMNGPAVTTRNLEPPTSVPTAPTPVSRALDALPANAVLLELPFGDVSWEIRYLYLSMFHWRRLVNGYSGDTPPHYVRLRDALALLPEEGGDRAWQVLRQSGATHAIVHGAAFGPARAAAMRAWLDARGARALTHTDDVWIYALP